jgi:hypothetical protein
MVCGKMMDGRAIKKNVKTKIWALLKYCFVLLFVFVPLWFKQTKSEPIQIRFR